MGVSCFPTDVRDPGVTLDDSVTRNTGVTRYSRPSRLGPVFYGLRLATPFESPMTQLGDVQCLVLFKTPNFTCEIHYDMVKFD